MDQLISEVINYRLLNEFVSRQLLIRCPLGGALEGPIVVLQSKVDREYPHWHPNVFQDAPDVA